MICKISWEQSHVSPYATMHPWEDWAETWAHYLHIVDTLETAAALGIRIDPDIDEDGALSADINMDPYRVLEAKRLIATWQPLTVALNVMNRSMGMPDLYPFVRPGQFRRTGPAKIIRSARALWRRSSLCRLRHSCRDTAKDHEFGKAAYLQTRYNQSSPWFADCARPLRHVP
jgi:hypothetical protein